MNQFPADRAFSSFLNDSLNIAPTPDVFSSPPNHPKMFNVLLHKLLVFFESFRVTIIGYRRHNLENFEFFEGVGERWKMGIVSKVLLQKLLVFFESFRVEDNRV